MAELTETTAQLILPLIGVFALIANLIIPGGFILSPFKPPRLCV